MRWTAPSTCTLEKGSMSLMRFCSSSLSYSLFRCVLIMGSSLSSALYSVRACVCVCEREMQGWERNHKGSNLDLTAKHFATSNWKTSWLTFSKSANDLFLLACATLFIASVCEEEGEQTMRTGQMRANGQHPRLNILNYVEINGPKKKKRQNKKCLLTSFPACRSASFPLVKFWTSSGLKSRAHKELSFTAAEQTLPSIPDAHADKHYIQRRLQRKKTSHLAVA